MEIKKVRSSNIELLRIVAMIMVIMFHISYHCVAFQLIDKDSIARLGNGLFCYPLFYKKLFLIEGFLPLGRIANAIFILISGYFMVQKENIDIGNISKKLLLQVGFASMFLTIASTIYYFINKPHNNIAISTRLITEFNILHWFVGYYFLLVVMAKLFLNNILEKLDEKKYRNVLLTIFAIISFGWSGVMLESLASGLRTLVCGVFLYAFGGYLKRYNPFAKIKIWTLFVTIVIIYFLIYISYYNVVYNDIHSYLIKATRNPSGVFFQPIIRFQNYDIISVIIAVVLFELFIRIRIPNNKFINFISSGTLMIYLLHDNDFMKSIWRESDWIDILKDNQLFYCLKLLIYTGLVFSIGIIAYMGFIALGKFCVKYKNIFVNGDDKVVSKW